MDKLDYIEKLIDLEYKNGHKTRKLIKHILELEQQITYSEIIDEDIYRGDSNGRSG